MSRFGRQASVECARFIASKLVTKLPVKVEAPTADCRGDPPTTNNSRPRLFSIPDVDAAQKSAAVVRRAESRLSAVRLLRSASQQPRIPASGKSSGLPPPCACVARGAPTPAFARIGHKVVVSAVITPGPGKAAFEHFNEVHPHSSLKMQSPREFRQNQTVKQRPEPIKQPALHCD